MSTKEHETIADIVAEMRLGVKDWKGERLGVFDCFADRIEAAANLAKEIAVERKHTMDFGRFHVTRAAIPGRTLLTFRRKQEVDAEHGSVVPGRIIIAEIVNSNVVSGKVVHTFVVKSYEAGEKPRVLLNGDSHVSMSKTEKMVYKMVKCSIKETQRRYIMRKRSRAAKREREAGADAAQICA